MTDVLAHVYILSNLSSPRTHRYTSVESSAVRHNFGPPSGLAALMTMFASNRRRPRGSRRRGRRTWRRRWSARSWTPPPAGLLSCPTRQGLSDGQMRLSLGDSVPLRPALNTQLHVLRCSRGTGTRCGTTVLHGTSHGC